MIMIGFVLALGNLSFTAWAVHEEEYALATIFGGCFLFSLTILEAIT